MKSSIAAVVGSGALLSVVAAGNENAPTVEKPDIASPPVGITLQPTAPKRLEPIGNPVAVVYCCSSAGSVKPIQANGLSLRELEQFHSSATAAISDLFGRPVRLFGSSDQIPPTLSAKRAGEGSKE